jgi:hypothetical protein
MQKFIPTGKIEKVRNALTLTVDGWSLGTLVISADNVPALLRGREVDIHFLQQHGEEAFIGYAGRARPSRSGKAITFWIESRMCTVPRKALEAVVSGKRPAARVSSPAPIIDADREQAKAIDAGLIHAF